jgi:redox-sensitive bicupin YhaK (pirin superfamily)
MIKIRKAEDRGHAYHGWLDSYHTFSFADYYDPSHMGFRDLRVINEDTIDPAQGFGTHSHNNMEIISYVLEGALAHKDSMGTTATIKPGEVQRMSAGSGVSHSEFNNLPDQKTHFLQIWILPEKKNIQPGYEQKFFADTEKQGKLRLVASSDGREGSVSVNQDINLYASLLDNGEEVTYEIPSGRYVWLHIARGKVRVNNEYDLKKGDAISAGDEKLLKISGVDKAEILLFDLK